MFLCRERSIILPMALLFLSLGGCTTAAQRAQEELRLQKMVEGMDQCLQNQAAVSAQLAEQQGQLEQQQRQLLVLTENQVAAGVLPATRVRGMSAVNCQQDDNTPGKLIVGELEQAWLPNLGLALPARVDTGAETASLDAHNIELFERDSRRWVRFEIQHPGSGEPLLVERKLKRMVTIMQSNTTEPERRPVIKLAVTIGHITQTAEFTLSNRSHLDYQLLVGRNILQDVMVVDVSKKNIAPYESSAGAVEGAPGTTQ